MTAYSSTDILEAMSRGDIAISDYNEDQLQPNSYDIRLGRYFFTVLWGGAVPWYVGPQVLKTGEEILVPSGGTILGMTEERVGTFGKVYSKLQGRSTKGRKCFGICWDAGSGDIGYDNHWTLELRSNTSVGFPLLTVGQRVGQMLFFETKSKPVKPYRGQYNLNDWPTCMVPKDSRHRIVPDFNTFWEVSQL